ncbi:MAG: fasciclin domain-containing protein [Deltaproteobacteria bacterium]|nr:fasciclin domain-containing protein [Deltaproteobacteria bacterium]
MKPLTWFFAVVTTLGCQNPDSGTTAQTAQSAAPAQAAQPAVDNRPVDPTNIVSIASGSKDHTTLVAALKAADYITSIKNPGPFTVFAPTNAAFDKLPKGTVEGLLKPEKQNDLKTILKYHVAVSTYQLKDLKDGLVLPMANGGKATIQVKDGQVTIGGAKIVASIPASNGIVHVIDSVLLPPA